MRWRGDMLFEDCLELRERLIIISGLVSEMQDILRKNGRDFNGEALHDDLYYLNTLIEKCFSSVYAMEEKIWEKRNQ